MTAVGPAYPMFGRDFDSSTAAWSNQEVGAYLRLLNHQWERGVVPEDLREVASIIRETPTRTRDLWTRRLQEKFPSCPDGKRRNPKLEAIRRDRELYVEAQIAKGRRGAETKYGRSYSNGHSQSYSRGEGKGDSYGGGRDDGLPLPLPSSSVVSSPPDGLLNDSLSALSAERSARAEEGFDSFWLLYPKKVGKRDARKAWKQTAKERPELAALLSSLGVLAASGQWREESGRFVPHPATWLRRGGWDDEPETRQPKAPAGSPTRIPARRADSTEAAGATVTKPRGWD